MARYQYFAITSSAAGKENEFDTWYDTIHLRDVRAVPGICGARRFRLSRVSAEGMDPPTWRSLAIYEIETDGDPEEVVRGIVARAGTALMPLSAALSREGMVQMVGIEVNPAKPAESTSELRQ